MSVYAFKLITGEDLIATLVDQTDATLVVKDPAMIIVQRTDTGFGVGLQPYTPYAKDNKVTFFKNALSATFDVDTQMENEYNRIFGNGLILATADQIKL